MPRPKKQQSPTPEFEVDLTKSFEEIESLSKAIFKRHARISFIIESMLLAFLIFLILSVGFIIGLNY